MGFIKIGIVQVKKENEYRRIMTNQIQIHRKICVQHALFHVADFYSLHTNKEII